MHRTRKIPYAGFYTSQALAHSPHRLLSPSLRYVWITDSCPETAEAVRDQAPFELLTLAGPIAAALQV